MLKNSCSEERWRGPGRFAEEWRLHSVACLGLIHCALNPLERLLSLWMAILVRVKLLRQFTVKLGKLSGLHLLHAGNQHVNRTVKELVHYVDLVLLLKGICRAAPQVCFHLLHRSFVDFLLNRRQTLSFSRFGMPLRVCTKLLITRVSSLTLVEAVVLQLAFHLLSSFPEHLFLHLGDVFALLLFLSA